VGSSEGPQQREAAEGRKESAENGEDREGVAIGSAGGGGARAAAANEVDAMAGISDWNHGFKPYIFSSWFLHGFENQIFFSHGSSRFSKPFEKPDIVFSCMVSPWF